LPDRLSLQDLLEVQTHFELPSPAFHEFFTDKYELHESRRVGSRFDFGTPRSYLGAALRAGTAGVHHAQLGAFFKEFERLLTVANNDNPGRRRFDDLARYIARTQVKTWIVLPDEIQLAFAEWRIENDPLLANDRIGLTERLTLMEISELQEKLSSPDSASVERVVFIEPRADDVLTSITLPGLAQDITISTNLARVEQILRRARILVSLDGIDGFNAALTRLATECERVLAGHRSDIGDLDDDARPWHPATIDFTASGYAGVGAGPVRTIQLTGPLRVRAFDGSEFAVYEPGVMRHFARKLAKDLIPGDQVCVFDADYMEAARARLRKSVDAPEVLRVCQKINRTSLGNFVLYS